MVHADGLAGSFAEARQHAEHAVGHTGFGGQSGDTQGSHAGLLGRLHDDARPNRERRADLPTQHHQREVPRQHNSYHRDWFAHDDAQRLATRWRRLVVDLVDAFGEPFDAARCLGHIDIQAVANWFAALKAFEHCEVDAVAIDELRQTLEHGLALAGVALRPHARVERVARAAHREVYIGGIAAGDIGDDRTIGGIDGFEGLA